MSYKAHVGQNRRGGPAMRGALPLTGIGYGRRPLWESRLCSVALVLLGATWSAATSSAELSADDVRMRIEAAGRAPPDLADLDLTGLDLAAVDFKGADLRGSVLKGANLAGADLSDAKLDLVILRDANLTGARLAGASGFQ